MTPKALRNDFTASRNSGNQPEIAEVQTELLAEVSPGVFRPLVPRIAMPRYVVCKLIPNGDGTYRSEPANEWTNWVKIKDVVSDCRMPAMCLQSLRRLIQAGFIDGAQITPGHWYVDIDSLFDHIEATICIDPDDSFWTEERRKVYASVR